MEISRIDGEAITPDLFNPFERAVGTLGSEQFYRTFSRELEQEIHVDRLYLIDGSARSQPLIAETEADKPVVTGSAYVSNFLPSDPLQAAIEQADADGTFLRLEVQPRDIVVPSYRAMLERSGVVERVSFLRKHRGGTWRCLTVARRRQSGIFEPRELDWLGGFFRLLSPLIDRHRALVGEVVEDRSERIAEIERRFAKRFPELTPRERQVCARAVLGISVEGAALDLGIAASSILTYRKRAYHRLTITSANELAALVLR